jgi:hypothetical protein
MLAFRWCSIVGLRYPAQLHLVRTFANALSMAATAATDTISDEVAASIARAAEYVAAADALYVTCGAGLGKNDFRASHNTPCE